MYKEVNTGTNLPAQIELYATAGNEYHFLFIAKGGGSANKTFLYQQTKAVLNEGVPKGKDTDNRDSRLPSVSLGHSDWRAQCRNDIEDSKTTQH